MQECARVCHMLVLAYMLRGDCIMKFVGPYFTTYTSLMHT